MANGTAHGPARWALVLFVCGLLSGACRRPSDAPAPGLMQSSTVVLRSQIQHALERIRSAKREAHQSPEAAIESLDDAERTLRVMEEYYLPLMEAVERAQKAYRLYGAGDTEDAVGELNAIEKLLVDLSGEEEEVVVPELEAALERTVDARLALTRKEKEASTKLGDLIQQLNAMVLKGELMFSMTGKS